MELALVPGKSNRRLLSHAAGRSFELHEPAITLCRPASALFYCTICESSPFLYFSAIFSSGIGLMRAAWPSQPKARKRDLQTFLAASRAGFRKSRGSNFDGFSAK